jgi:cytochrome c553
MTSTQLAEQIIPIGVADFSAQGRHSPCLTQIKAGQPRTGDEAEPPMKTAPRVGLVSSPFSARRSSCFQQVASWQRAAAADPPAPGLAVYAQHCAACHGATGDGNGPASVWLFPRPRDFSAGQFKIKSTPGQSLPTDDDLLQSVTRGLAGSSMPSFSYLARRSDGKWSVTSSTSPPTGTGAANGQLVRRSRGERHLAKPVEVPEEPAAGVQELTLGRDVYRKNAVRPVPRRDRRGRRAAGANAQGCAGLAILRATSTPASSGADTPGVTFIFASTTACRARP